MMVTTLIQMLVVALSDVAINARKPFNHNLRVYYLQPCARLFN